MTLRDFLLSVAAVTVFSWIAWITVILYIDPEVSGFIGLFVFYASLFFSLLGTFILLGLGLRVAFRKLHHQHVIAFTFISPAIRQGMWFSLVVLVSLMLLASNLFAWWSVLLLLVAFSILEGFYLIKQFEQTPRHDSSE